MKIINNNGKIQLKYVSKIHTINKKRKNKDGTTKTNTFYMASIPEEIKQYLDIDNTIYFYEHKDVVYISKEKPVQDHKLIKINVNNQFSIPKKFFKTELFTSVILLLDVVDKSLCIKLN